MTHMHHIFWIHVFMMEYVIITIRKIFQHCRLIFSDWNRRYQIELTVPIWLVVKSEKSMIEWTSGGQISIQNHFHVCNLRNKIDIHTLKSSDFEQSGASSFCQASNSHTSDFSLFSQDIIGVTHWTKIPSSTISTLHWKL